MSVDRVGKTFAAGDRGFRLCGGVLFGLWLRIASGAVLAVLFLAGPVAGARRSEPDPISNSAVKRLSADGTVSQDTGE